MEYDYLKHVVRETYASPITWEGRQFVVRFEPCSGPRIPRILVSAAMGLMLSVAPLMISVAGGVRNVRHGIAVGVFLLLGIAFLYLMARSARQRLFIEGNSESLALCTEPIPPKRREIVPLAEIESCTAVRRPVTEWQRFGRAHVNETMMPWSVTLHVAGREPMLLPLHLRPAEDEQLARDLEGALAEARRQGSPEPTF